MMEYTISLENIVLEKSKVYFCNHERDFKDSVFRYAYLLYSWLIVGQLVSSFERIVR